MKAPKGLRLPEGYVLKLHRTLQGTKQAAHDFHCHKVDKLLTKYGLSSNPNRIWSFIQPNRVMYLLQVGI
jgi:hypothetical protein